MKRSLLIQQKTREMAKDLTAWAHHHELLAPGMGIKVVIRFEGRTLSDEDWKAIGLFNFKPEDDHFVNQILRALYATGNRPVAVKALQQLFRHGFEPHDMAYFNDCVYTYTEQWLYALRVTKPLRRDDPASWDENSVVIVKYDGTSYDPRDEIIEQDPYLFYERGGHNTAPAKPNYTSSPSQRTASHSGSFSRRGKKPRRWK